MMTMAGRVYVAGHTGLVGSAFVRAWSGRPGVELITATRAELDLTDQDAVTRWLAERRPQLVVLAAGRVGGIQANASLPASFIYENLMIEANVIHGAWRAGVARLVNFGSACMYPKSCSQPMRVEQLQTGPMEPTSGPYAIAKLAGMALCEAYNGQHGTRFLNVIPCTLYGPGDNFDPADSHVLSALIRKFHDARERGDASVTLWGTGSPQREFLFVDDLVGAVERLLESQSMDASGRTGAGDRLGMAGAGPINIGSGDAIQIRELAAVIAEIVGFQGTVAWDAARPDGAAEKRLESSSIRALGWEPRIALRDGIERTYRWFLEHEAAAHKEPLCTSS